MARTFTGWLRHMLNKDPEAFCGLVGGGVLALLAVVPAFIAVFPDKWPEWAGKASDGATLLVAVATFLLAFVQARLSYKAFKDYVPPASTDVKSILDDDPEVLRLRFPSVPEAVVVFNGDRYHELAYLERWPQDEPRPESSTFATAADEHAHLLSCPEPEPPKPKCYRVKLVVSPAGDLTAPEARRRDVVHVMKIGAPTHTAYDVNNDDCLVIKKKEGTPPTVPV